MSKIEYYANGKGDEITIEEGPDGVTVNAKVRTVSKYSGGANAAAARSWAAANGLTKQ